MSVNSPLAASSRNIVILGGSYGGVSTAHYTLKHVLPQLPSKDSYQLILVSSSSQALCRPACPRALIADDLFDQNKLFVNIPLVFEQYPKSSFRFINAAATELDHISRSVSVSFSDGTTEKIDFYALVIATGASTTSPLHGLNYGEEHLRTSWAEFRKALPTAKSIVIAGGGPTAVETAGELGEYLNGRAGWFSSKPNRPKVSIILVTSGSEILPGLRAAIAQKAGGYLSQVGVTIMRNARIIAVTPAGAGTTSVSGKATLTLDNGTTLEADLYIPATGIKPNTGFVHRDLLSPDGRVETNSSTLRVDKAGPRIYAVGDAAAYSRPAVHLILNAIPVVCTNLKRDLLLASEGDTTHTTFIKADRLYVEDTRETQLVPIGTSKGVGAAMGYQLPSLLVWLIKGRDYWLWTTGGLWSGKTWSKES